jgi:hypothetical protein
VLLTCQTALAGYVAITLTPVGSGWGTICVSAPAKVAIAGMS